MKGMITDDESFESLLIDAIMNGDPAEELKPPFVIKKANYKAYKDAIIMLSELKKQGKVEFECDDIRKAYELHCVFVHLKYGDKGFSVIESAKELSELLNKFDGFTTTHDCPDEWNLNIQIYFPKERS